MLWDMSGSWKGKGAGRRAGTDPGVLNAGVDGLVT